VISEIDIWRVANPMLRRYGDYAEGESARRVDELAADGDDADVALFPPSATHQWGVLGCHSIYP